MPPVQRVTGVAAGRRLLVIDNDLESDAVRWFFQSREFDLDVVKDPAKGLREAGEHPVDTVIVNAGFGSHYVAELARRLRDSTCSRPRIIALADPSEAGEAIAADAVVVRPFHLEYLYEIVTRDDGILTHR